MEFAYSMSMYSPPVRIQMSTTPSASATTTTTTSTPALDPRFLADDAHRQPEHSRNLSTDRRRIALTRPPRPLLVSAPEHADTNTNTNANTNNNRISTNSNTQPLTAASASASASASAPAPTSTSAPVLAPTAPIASVSTASASASLSHAHASDPERQQPASPKSSNTDSGYHYQHTTASYSLPQKRLYRRDSANSPTSPAQTFAGPSSPVRRKSSRGKKHHDAMPVEPGQSNPSQIHATTPYRADGASLSGPTLTSRTATMPSSENMNPSSAEGSIAASTASTSTRMSLAAKPFIVRNNRTYINEPNLLQSLRTLMLFQLFGGPTTAPGFSNKPPSRVLEIGCGSAFWSMMCHRYFAQHGYSQISFTGIDIVPLPDRDMRWRFVQHDMRRTPWPLAENEFDLIMVKDMSLCNSMRDHQHFFEEYLRILKPGGVLEFWESDHTIRMLRPHVLKTPAVTKVDSDSDSDDSSEEEDSNERLGAYAMTNNTPLSAPLNPFLVEYNGWATKALDARGLSSVPCTLIGPNILQEADILTDIRSKRLAVPLSEIRWEREGVGGVVTKDGKSYIDSMKGKGKAAADPKGEKPRGKALTASQAALRRTALETVVGMIQCLEPVLREVSGKSQDEWDNWNGKMVNDLLRDGGTSWGECLEVGAWCAKKKQDVSA
ncbi:methyltransferase domain-containing protein [Hypoxylon sp. FL1284]|nr:methyltransferase domain-containing protein [Hypoxylon sp. FL1284]